MRFRLAALLAVLGLAEAGCGLGVSQLPEVWDRSGPFATAQMELQIKNAIFCELRAGAILARTLNSGQQYTYQNQNVTTAADLPLPDTWGAQVTLTLTADEKGSSGPSVMFKNPIAPASLFGQNVSQSFSLGLGASLSSENVRYDKYSFYYSVKDLVEDIGPSDTCHVRPAFLGPPSSSSPFVKGVGLGIRDWLPGAVAVDDFQRSSRAAANGEGDPLGGSGFTPDSMTYDNKFVIISDGNITPTWNLVKFGTGTTPLLDLTRTRTHELLITVGPGQTATGKDKKTGKLISLNIGGPSSAAASSHLASEIGSAVAAAIGPASH
jgi:hypothetical protein